MDELPECSIVLSVGERCVEAGQTPAAKAAAPIFIERISVQERSLAIDAKVFGKQRRGGGKAIRTHRDSRDFVKRSAADAAIVREDKIKHRRRNSPCNEFVDIRQNSE
jgi:hypothetical protein